MHAERGVLRGDTRREEERLLLAQRRRNLGLERLEPLALSVRVLYEQSVLGFGERGELAQLHVHGFRIECGGELERRRERRADAEAGQHRV